MRTVKIYKSEEFDDVIRTKGNVSKMEKCLGIFVSGPSIVLATLILSFIVTVMATWMQHMMWRRESRLCAADIYGRHRVQRLFN